MCNNMFFQECVLLFEIILIAEGDLGTHVKDTLQIIHRLNARGHRSHF